MYDGFHENLATCAIFSGLHARSPRNRRLRDRRIGADRADAERIGYGSPCREPDDMVGELDARWRRDDAAQQAQAFQQLYEGRKTRWTRSLPRC